MDNRPLSEIWREAADEWVDKDAAARLLEDTKTAVMAQKQAALGDIPVNKAEQIVKASADWHRHLVKIVDARTEANKALVNRDYIKMKYGEWNSHEANQRTEARL